MLLSHLHYFSKLADTEHYGLAAEELHITQPTLSYAIKSLEKELNVSLFERDGRGVRLTAEGQYFASAIKQSLFDIDKAIRKIQGGTSTLSGVINIGSVFTVQGDYLPRLIKNFNRDVPNTIKFNINQGFSNALVEDVLSGKYDVAFSAMVRNKPQLEYVHVMSHELVLVVSENSKYADLDCISLEELKNEEVCTYRLGTPIGDEVADLLSTFNIKARYEWEDEISLGGLASTDSNLLVIATLTIGLKLFPNIKKIPITGIPKNFHRIYLAYKQSDSYKGKALEAFIEYVENYQASLTK